MKAKTACGLGSALIILYSTTSYAQRTQENTVTSAEDAFGTSVGYESLGLYNETNVRGFSPKAAGNYRIDGLYFDEQAGFTGRVMSGSTIRVGPAAQGFAFPAPTGIVDISLRESGSKRGLSMLDAYGPFGSYAVELDAQLPIVGDRLTTAAGGSYYDNIFSDGGRNRQYSLGVVPRWRLSDKVLVTGFWGESKRVHETTSAVYVTDGDFLPSDVDRGKYTGPSWATLNALQVDGGLLGRAVFGKWTARIGLFRSVYRDDGSFQNVFDIADTRNVDRSIIAYPSSRNASTSGEARLSRKIDDGPRRHIITIALRGRRIDSEYGGDETIELGPGSLNGFDRSNRPEFHFGVPTDERVRQITGAISYGLEWSHIGQATLGIQRTHYVENVDTSGADRSGVTSDDWLPTASATVHILNRLSVYGSFVKGLEDAGVAPGFADNGHQVLPAIRTRQWDASLKWSPIKSLNLIFGYFDVTKPYIAIDSHNIYGVLGRETHSGIEFSVTAKPFSGLTLVAGAVQSNPRVSSQKDLSEDVGEIPVGQPKTTIQLNGNYVLPFASRFSVDGNVRYLSRQAGTVDDGVYIKPYAVVDIGARFAFVIGKSPAVLRVSITNLTDKFAFNSQGSGAYGVIDRRGISGTLTSDF